MRKFLNERLWKAIKDGTYQDTRRGQVPNQICFKYSLGIALKNREVLISLLIHVKGQFQCEKIREVYRKVATFGLEQWHEMKRGSARRRSEPGLNFHCHLHAWQWQRRNELGLGDRRCLSGSSMMKLGKRHVLWRDRAGEVFPVEKGNIDAVSPSLSGRVAWPTQRSDFSHQTSSVSGVPFQGSLGISALCQDVKVCSATSSPPGKLNLLKGHGIGPIEQHRKG